jgi:cell division protein ZapA (FtsZ GTPase activity inhibitor)
MDKVQITIRGRSYTLRTDESPERIEQIAASLDERIAEFTNAMRGRPEGEVLTLVAFDLMEQADDNSNEVKRMKDVLEESETKNKQLLIENMNSAESELFQIASVKEQENVELRAKIQGYEEAFEAQISQTYTSAEKELDQIVRNKQRENDELRMNLVEFERELDSRATEIFNSAINEAKENAESKEEENQKLLTMLENFEKTFDNYAKTKEREIVQMQEEIEALKFRLMELSDDGQMTLV